jgi:hypothetical protein
MTVVALCGICGKRGQRRSSMTTTAARQFYGATSYWSRMRCTVSESRVSTSFPFAGCNVACDDQAQFERGLKHDELSHNSVNASQLRPLGAVPHHGISTFTRKKTHTKNENYWRDSTTVGPYRLQLALCVQQLTAYATAFLS